MKSAEAAKQEQVRQSEGWADDASDASQKLAEALDQVVVLIDHTREHLQDADTYQREAVAEQWAALELKVKALHMDRV